MTAAAAAQPALDFTDRYDATEDRVHAFTWFDRAATPAADAAGPLAGVPFAVKDVFAVAGTMTACGSPALLGNVTGKDAEVVTRMRDAGAFLVGKLVTHELTCGVDEPPTRNPWRLDCYPGGSSAGAGVAVAVGACRIALGTDAAGSVRIPASATGVIGFKPTHGFVPTDGLQRLASAPSIDHVGIIARDVEDVRAAFRVLARPGARPETPPADLTGVRIGVPRWNAADSVLAREVEAVLRRALAVMEQLGAQLVDLEIPEFALVPEAVFTLFATELAAAHEARLSAYHPDVLALIELGAATSPAQIAAAEVARETVRQAAARVMEHDRIDVLVTPTMPVVPPALAELVPTRDLGVLTTYTAPFNLTGQPAVSVPGGFADGLPVGVQIVSHAFADLTALDVAGAYTHAAPQPAAPPV